MIRCCDDRDVELIWAIINDGARAYKGVIPADCWTEPYMSRNELRHEIEAGVTFWGYEESEALAGVMGVQQVQDVTLIRHAHVRAGSRNRGIGLRFTLVQKSCLICEKLAQGPVLIGTWADAIWAIRFYEKHGFHVVRPEPKDRLLRRYGTMSERQVEASAVLADPTWPEPG